MTSCIEISSLFSNVEHRVHWKKKPFYFKPIIIIIIIIIIIVFYPSMKADDIWKTL